MANVQKFYAHYNKDTNRIYSIANHKSTGANIEIPKADFLDFISGVKDFHQYTVNKKSIVPFNEVESAPTNSVFFLINEKSKKKTELIVEWNLKNKCWSFSMSDECKSKGMDTLSTYAQFFVVSKENFNLLYKNITISVSELIDNTCVTIPFTTDEEHDLSKINLATRFVFESYGLKIYD
jgi:hypothetical protein